MTRRFPPSVVRPPRRLAGALKPGPMGAGAVAYEIVCIFNATNIRYRIKTDQACNVDIIAMGPDCDPDFTGPLATVPGVGTQYATGGKITNAVVANTELKIEFAYATPDVAGEAYHLVKVTWGGTPGNIIWIDVCQLVQSGNA